MNSVKLSGTVVEISEKYRFADPKTENDFFTYRYIHLNHEDKFHIMIEVEGEIIAEALSRYYVGEHIEVEGYFVVEAGQFLIRATRLEEIDPKPQRPIPESELNDRLMDG